MLNFLNWQSADGIAITSPQLIAYRDEQGNVTNLPQIQFVITAQHELDDKYYPTIGAYDCTGKLVWQTSYRERDDFDSAFKFAKKQVERVFKGSFEDGHIRHDMLNGWAFEILKGLNDGTISKASEKVS